MTSNYGGYHEQYRYPYPPLQNTSTYDSHPPAQDTYQQPIQNPYPPPNYPPSNTHPGPSGPSTFLDIEPETITGEKKFHY
ncbi:3114_t:CDS:1, partial [Acaulospora morrowiae]